MNSEDDKLAFYPGQLFKAINGYPEQTVWKNRETAQAYWQQVQQATVWCSGYAAGLITRLQAKSGNPEVSITDIVSCETPDQLKAF